MRPFLRLITLARWSPHTGIPLCHLRVCMRDAFAFLHTFNALYQTFHIHTLDMERRVVLELLTLWGPPGVPGDTDSYWCEVFQRQ